MNEEFDPIKNRISDADPAKHAPLLNESLVAGAALATRAKAPWTKRVRQLVFSGSALASAAALALVVSISMPPAPLIQMAASGPNTKMSAESSMVAGDQAATSARMIWPGYIEYELDSTELSSERGNGKVYQLQLSGDPKALLRKVADYFQVSGEIREEEWSSAEYPSYGIGTPQRQVGLNWSGTGTFYFGTYDEGSFRCENKTITLENGETFETCEPIYTPELIPSEASIRAQALEIFTNFGLQITADQIRVDRYDWGASAAGSLRVDGQETALEWWVNFDGAGKLSNVYGHFATVVDRGEFKTVSAKEASERIKDGRWFGSAPSSVWGQQGMAMNARTADAPAVEPMPATTENKEVSPETTEIVEPEKQIVKLKLTGAKPQLLMIYDKSGGAWFVPGYLVQNDQDWFHAIISLEEGVIELPDPIEFGIMPVEPDIETKQD